MSYVRVLYLRDGRELYAPGLAYATAASVGLDLRACPASDAEGWLPDSDGIPALTLEPGQRAPVPAGLAVEPLEPGIAGFVYSRSGLGAVKGLTVAQGVGVIDPDYRGEITVWLLNTAAVPLSIQRGERVAQLVFQPVARPEPVEVDALGDTERGTGGFGHTGRQ